MLAFCLYALSGVHLGRGAFAIALVASIPGIVAPRARASNCPNENVFKRRGLVIGTGEKARCRYVNDYCLMMDLLVLVQTVDVSFWKGFTVDSEWIFQGGRLSGGFFMAYTDGMIPREW
ncbi:MAG: hypothetical protein ACRD98_07830, partial [Nitrososphaera sp.]